MKYLAVVIISFFYSIPLVSFASVYITEVAWMGSADNTNAEWVELYNNGEQVSVEGWTLVAIDGQPSITLAGTIGTNSYALLERSSDDTVPGEPAFHVYTGALGNSGEVLELRNQNGVLIDSVDGSGDWAIGGDNDTKETLQRSGSPPIGSWTTGAPSPQGSEPVEDDTTSDEEEDNNNNDESQDGGGDVAGVSTSKSAGGGILNTTEKHDVRVKHEPGLTLDIGGERTVTKGVPVTFLAQAFKESGKEIVEENILWNFGDGNIGKGREATHAYQFEGDYVVTAFGRRSGFFRDIQDTDTAVVHVRHSEIVLTSANSSYIEITNNSNKQTDISKYILISGTRKFTLPKNTFILPQATLRLSGKTTGITRTSGLKLFLPNGILVSTYSSKKEPVVKSVVKGGSDSTPYKTDYVEPVLEPGTPVPQTDFSSPELTASLGVPARGSVESAQDTNLWWWILGLFSAIVTAIVAVLIIRAEQQEVIEGFYIEGDEE